MLSLTLEAIAKRLPSNLQVNIYADAVPGDVLNEIEYARDTYLPTADLHIARPHTQAPSGCWNILNSLKAGYETGAEYVFLIEEDVIIQEGYFSWHADAFGLGAPSVVATCGRKDRRFYPAWPDIYTNPGSCLTRPLLERLVPHINDDYFTRLRAYMDDRFGVWDEQSDLDDGLIRRVIRELGGKCVYPNSGVCAHKGFHYYNILDIYKNEGPIENRVARLREMFATIKSTDRYAHDFEEGQ